jgi:hypothetical protein
MGMGRIFINLIEKCRTFFANFAEFVKSHLKAAAIAAAGFLVIMLLLLILAFVRSRSGETETARQDQQTMIPGAPPQALSTEDFFLPYEPDFVPGVLLEREPKSGWTEEDARPYWTDPMEGNEETWRKRIESGIDSMLEHVP